MKKSVTAFSQRVPKGLFLFLARKEKGIFTTVIKLQKESCL